MIYAPIRISKRMKSVWYALLINQLQVLLLSHILNSLWLVWMRIYLKLQVSLQIIMNGHAHIVHTGTQMEKINVKCAHKKGFLAQSQIRLNLKPINSNNPNNKSNLLRRSNFHNKSNLLRRNNPYSKSNLLRRKSLLPNHQAPNHLRSNILFPNHQAPNHLRSNTLLPNHQAPKLKINKFLLK